MSSSAETVGSICILARPSLSNAYNNSKDIYVKQRLNIFPIE